jgi:hypothetical protein
MALSVPGDYCFAVVAYNAIGDAPPSAYTNLVTA